MFLALHLSKAIDTTQRIMKNFFSALALLVAVSPSVVSADEFKLVLSCSAIPFSDIAQIEVYKNLETGDYIVEEYETAKLATRTILPAAVFEQDGTVPLSDWYGYAREIKRAPIGNGWQILHQDECSGGVGRVDCVEFSN